MVNYLCKIILHQRGSAVNFFYNLIKITTLFILYRFSLSSRLWGGPAICANISEIDHCAGLAEIFLNAGSIFIH